MHRKTGHGFAETIDFRNTGDKVGMALDKEPATVGRPVVRRARNQTVNRIIALLMPLSLGPGHASLGTGLGAEDVQGYQSRLRHRSPRFEAGVLVRVPEPLQGRRSRPQRAVQLRLHQSHGDERHAQELGNQPGRRRLQHQVVPGLQRRDDHGHHRQALLCRSAIDGERLHPQRRALHAGRGRFRRGRGRRKRRGEDRCGLSGPRELANQRRPQCEQVPGSRTRGNRPRRRAASTTR